MRFTAIYFSGSVVTDVDLCVPITFEFYQSFDNISL